MTTVARVTNVTWVMRVTRLAGGNSLVGESYPIILFVILQSSEFGVEEGDQSNWGNQVDQGDRREQDGEVSIMIFGISESSGFQKISYVGCCSCLCRCLCQCLRFIFNNFHISL